MSEVVLRRADGRPINPFATDEELGVLGVDGRRDSRAAHYHKARLEESTRRKYRFFIELWLDFCALTGRREMPGNAFGLEAFAIWLAEREVRSGRNTGKIGYSPNAIRLALASVRAFHEACGENPPSTRLARGIIDGHEKIRAEPGSGYQDGYQSPVVELPTFAEIIAAIPEGTNAGLRDRSMLTLGLAIMARRAELPQIDITGVTKTRDGWLQVRIPKTKGGKAGKVFVPPWPHLPGIDPVATWDRHVDRLAELGIRDGAAYRAVDRWDHVAGAPGMPWAGAQPGDGARLEPSILESIIARAAIAAGVSEAGELRPHGFLRASGATIAYNFGADILAICRQGRWAENSPVVFRYIRDIDQQKRNAMATVGREAA